MRTASLALSLAACCFVVACSAGAPDEPITIYPDDGGPGELDDLGSAFVESYPDVDGPLHDWNPSLSAADPDSDALPVEAQEILERQIETTPPPRKPQLDRGDLPAETTPPPKKPQLDRGDLPAKTTPPNKATPPPRQKPVKK
jgi:hypothetical protein